MKDRQLYERHSRKNRFSYTSAICLLEGNSQGKPDDTIPAGKIS